MRAWHFVIGLNPFKGRTIHVEMLTPFAIPRDRGSSHPGLNHRYKRLPLHLSWMREHSLLFVASGPYRVTVAPSGLCSQKVDD